jgi:hypothetical protein
MGIQVFGNALLVVTIAVLEFALIPISNRQGIAPNGSVGLGVASRADGRWYDYWAVDSGLLPLARA